MKIFIVKISVILLIVACDEPPVNDKQYKDSVYKAYEIWKKNLSDSLDSAIAVEMKMKKDFDSIRKQQHETIIGGPIKSN